MFSRMGALVKGLKRHFGSSRTKHVTSGQLSLEEWGFPFLAAWSMIVTLSCSKLEIRRLPGGCDSV